MGSLGEKRPHAVVLPFPIQGHINPLMQCCRALACKGFVITFINTERNQKTMHKDDEGLDIRYETVPNCTPAPSECDIFEKDNWLRLLQGVADMEASFEQLLGDKIAKQGPPVSCIISDLFVPWSQNVADRFGIPRVAFWCATSTCLLLDYNLPRLYEQGIVPIQEIREGEMVEVEGLDPLPLWSLPIYFRIGQMQPGAGVERKFERTQAIADAGGILVNSVEELEVDAFKALRSAKPNVFAIGPLLLLEDRLQKQLTQASEVAEKELPSLLEEDKGCLSWLDWHQPDSVLYISFGSVATLTAEQVEELTAALEQLGQPFLWALRPNAVKGMEGEDFQSFRSRVEKSGGLLVSWAPQPKVLKHAATGGFLTHCGWNSIVESICGGVPMLCWPCVAEQNLNCKLLVEDWKIALRFSNAVASDHLVQRQEFVEVVGMLMSSDEIRRNVEGLRDKVVAAVSDDGSSLKNLDKFISSLS